MTEKVQTKVYLPKDLKALLDADSRSNTEAVEAALWTEYGGRKESVLERRLEEVERREKMLEDEVDSRRDELKELRGERESIQQQLENIQNGLLDADEVSQARELLNSGERLFDTHTFVRRVAESHEIDVGSAHTAVKDQLGDEFPPIAFELSSPEKPTDWREASSEYST